MRREGKEEKEIEDKNEKEGKEEKEIEDKNEK